MKRPRSKMKHENQYRKWMAEMFEKYKSVLFIEKYHLQVTHNKETHYLASKFNYPYLDIEILYTEKSLNDWKRDKKDAERRLIHEFCHTITDSFYSAVTQWPSKPVLEDARERLTDHIAQIVNKHFNLL